MGTDGGAPRIDDVARFYDDRVENVEDLNTRLAGPDRPVHHHTGIVRGDELIPVDEAAALAWLYRCEEALTDLVWNVLQGVSPRGVRQILDAGCGEGATLARFVELSRPQSLQCRGITLSEKQAAISQRNLSDASWFVGDMRDATCFPPGAFDAITAIESTEYLGAGGLEAFMRNVAAWLRPDGVAVMVVGSVKEGLVLDDEDQKGLEAFDEHYVTRLLSTDSYRRAARKAGLVPVGELDLVPATLRYWHVRRDRPGLRNSEDGRIEDYIARGLEAGLGDFRLFAWMRPANERAR